LTHAGATVEQRIVPIGHGLSQADLSLTKTWLARVAATRKNGTA
jgi:phospholipase/carboxylesterase